MSFGMDVTNRLWTHRAIRGSTLQNSVMRPRVTDSPGASEVGRCWEIERRDSVAAWSWGWPS
jgi:hypothetical protein